MLKTKFLSLGLHLLDEQVDRLQESANQMSLLTGHDIDQIESMIIRLLMPEQPPLDDIYRIEWIDADTVRLRKVHMDQRALIECPVCHGAKTLVKAGNTEDCATCDATGLVEK